MSALDGLLGRVLTDDVEIELSEGINFKNGMVATLNPATNLTEVSFGAGVDHGDMQIADGIHGTFWKTFLNQTDRRAFPLIAAYVGRRALQLSDATVWDVLPVPGSSPQTYGWGLSCAGLESAFTGDFAALAVSYGLTVEWDFDPTTGTSGTTGTGISGWTPRAGTAGAMTAGAGATNGIGTVTAGLNGKAGISADGSTQGGTFTSSGPVAPATTNQHHWAVGRFLSYVSSRYLWADGSLGQALYMNNNTGSSCNIAQYNQGGAGAITTGVVLNQWYRMYATWAGAASADKLRVGAHAPAASATFLNAVPTATQTLFDSGAGGARSSWETLRYMKLRGTSANFQLFDADASVKAQSFWTSAIEI